MHPRAKKCRQLPEVGRGARKRFSPGSPRRNQPRQHFVLPQPWERHEKQFSNLPRHRSLPSPADLSVLLNGSPLEHTSLVVTSPGSLLPCPWHPLVNGPFDSCYCLFSPAPGSYTPCPEVPGVENRGCVGWGRGQAVVFLARENPPSSLCSVVELGRNHPTNPGRMGQQSRSSRIK